MDVFKDRGMMTLDISNAYIQTSVSVKKIRERIAMKARRLLVDWLVSINPISYSHFVGSEHGSKTLYMVIQKAIYGMLEAGLFWYRKFQNDLQEERFHLQPL